MYLDMVSYHNEADEKQRPDTDAEWFQEQKMVHFWIVTRWFAHDSSKTGVHEGMAEVDDLFS